VNGETLELISNDGKGTLPQLIVFRGAPLYEHLRQNGWDPWHFGQHGVTIHKKPAAGGDPDNPDYYYFTPLHDERADEMAPATTLAKLLVEIWDVQRRDAGIPRAESIDVSVR